MMTCKIKHDLSDRLVWITGASSGIGRACALRMSQRGARLILSGRNQDKLNALVAELGADRAWALPFDATSREATLAAAQQIEKQHGRLDVAFFNAGDCEYVDVKNFDSALFERVFRINFFGMVYGVEAALPLLRRSHNPLLVAMCSATAFGPLPTAEAYGASKAAVRYLFETLTMTLAGEGIDVSIIYPGFVQTPLTDKNTFPMPFRIPVETAARIIVRRLEKGRKAIHFPWRFTVPYKILALAPGPVYRWIVRNITL